MLESDISYDNPITKLCVCNIYDMIQEWYLFIRRGSELSWGQGSVILVKARMVHKKTWGKGSKGSELSWGQRSDFS